ncbi:hypothetical protein M569_03282, partial [Genlisea aurea]
MCIAVFMWRTHSRYPLLLLLNRDEYHCRPTTALEWWADGEILGGRDVEAGGTWLASSKKGRLAFLTNVREIDSKPRIKSRGDLPVRFLKSEKNPGDFAEELVAEADDYNGFNLVVADLPSLTMLYITNRNTAGLLVSEVTPGMHVLSNAQLDTPWPKAQRLLHSFEEAVKLMKTEVSLPELAEILKDTRKDSDSKQLPGIYPPEFEYLLSSIFVEASTPSGRYGTRSISAVGVDKSGVVSFYENHLEDEEAWE